MNSSSLDILGAIVESSSPPFNTKLSQTIFNFHDTLLIATSLMSALFVLLISFGKRDHHFSDVFLIGFFLAQAAIPIHILINFGDVVSEIVLKSSPGLFHAFDIAYWFEGPLLLWYTRSLLYREFKLRRKDLIYLIPVVFYAGYIAITFHSLDAEQQVRQIMESRELLAPSLPHSIEAIREALFVFFGVLCLIEIRHAQQQIHHRYSNLVKIDFLWLGTLVAVFMFLRSWLLLVTGVAFAKPDLDPEIFNTLGLVGNYVMFGMVSMLIFFSLTRATVFAGKIVKQDSNTHTDEVEIDPEVAQKILRHMEFHKPYLSHYLNLEQLANQLSMHPRALSSAIKHSFNTNFYEFINSYRIEEAKKLLLDPEQPNRTMIDILGEAGFNSKATFNAFFKKMVGMTPSQYRAEHNPADA